MDRFYRDQFNIEGLHSFRVEIMESDLFIVSDENLEELANTAVKLCRLDIEEYIRLNPEFRTSLVPIGVSNSAPAVIKKMAQAAEMFGVGPMAAVAGAVSQYVGEALSPHCSHIIVENGGDIYLKSSKPLKIGVYAGHDSAFTGNLCFEVDPQGRGLGVCTSSKKVGPSLSFGNTDAVVTVADTAEVADAAATAIGNVVKTSADIINAIDSEAQRGLLKGIIIVINDKMGAWGDIKLI